MENNYLVSVIIPTYKRADMLTKAIDSVLTQTYKNVEVLVIDDNNPNTEWRALTSEIMKQYSLNTRVRYICHEINKNGSAARNTGIQNANGEIITFLDDDDIYMPDKIEKQVTYLVENPKKHCVVCGWHRDGKDEIPPSEEKLMFNLLSGLHIIYTNTIMMWAADAKACGGFDITFKRHQEASFLLRYMRMDGRIGIVKEVLVDFNLDDRSNVANPTQDEEYTIHYLESFGDMIKRCEAAHPGSEREIWFRRYRWLWVSYIRAHQYGNAIKLHYRASKRMPIVFSVDLLKYVFWRLFMKRSGADGFENEDKD